MGCLNHKSATCFHYDKEAKCYDDFNEKNSTVINKTLTRLFREYQVETIVDLACGTGSQVFLPSKRDLEQLQRTLAIADYFW